MTFIDWSDPEGLFELLLEYVRDEEAECRGDVPRKKLLSGLVARLESIAVSGIHSPEQAKNRLQQILDTIGPEFLDDPVTTHFRDCIDELKAHPQGAKARRNAKRN